MAKNTSASLEPKEPHGSQELVRQMEARFFEDSATAENLSGPVRDHALLRDSCVPAFIFKILGIARPKRLLDMGCGTGSLTRILSTISDEVLGMDAVADAIKIASTRHSKIGNLRFEVSNIFSFKLPAESFDIVHVREFHPLTRDIYKTEPERKAAHSQILKTLASALSQNGYLFIAHKKGKRQCINASDTKSIPGLELVCHGIDGRVLFLIAPITGYRPISLTISKILSWPLKIRRTVFFEVIVLKKVSETP